MNELQKWLISITAEIDRTRFFLSELSKEMVPAWRELDKIWKAYDREVTRLDQLERERKKVEDILIKHLPPGANGKLTEIDFDGKEESEDEEH